MTDGQSEACAANAVGMSLVDPWRDIEIFDEGRWLPATLAARGSGFVVVRFENDRLRIVRDVDHGVLLRNSPVRVYKRWLALCANGGVAIGACELEARANALRTQGVLSGECRIVAVREIEWTDERKGV